MTNKTLSTESPKYVLPGLTPGQLHSRVGGLGASDAEKIMTGNWVNLWREKTGRQSPEDLSQNLPVCMGKATEAFNAYWFEKMSGIAVNRSPAVVERTHRHRKKAWMLANIDGLVEIDKRLRLFEAKHTNAFGSRADLPARYLAQMQHAIEVMDLEGCELSVFFGNATWERFTVERDRDYAKLLMEREAEFWSYVQQDKPPPGDLDAGPTAPGLELMRQLDWRTNNLWMNFEAIWIAERIHQIRFDDAEAKLKEMVPADADFVFGEELVCVRDRGGKLSLRYPNKKDLLRRQDLIMQFEEETGPL